MKKFWNQHAKIGEIVTVISGGREFVGEVVEKSLDIPNNNGIKMKEIKGDGEKADYTGNVVCIPITPSTILLSDNMPEEKEVGKVHEPKATDDEQGEEKDD